MRWFFTCWYKFRKPKSYFNNHWVGMVKNGQGLIDHGTLKSGVSHKWFDELSRSIEWFLPGIFPSTFPQPVNGSKNSILNWVMKLNLYMFFSSLFLKHPWKNFWSICLFFLLFGLNTYKHAYRKHVCMIFKIPIKIREKAFSHNLQT